MFNFDKLSNHTAMWTITGTKKPSNSLHNTHFWWFYVAHKKERGLEQLGCRLTCLALAKDSHGLSTRCVHGERIILWDLQQSIHLPHSAQDSQLLVQAETHLRNTAKSRHCWLIIYLPPTLSPNKVKYDIMKLYWSLWGSWVSAAANSDEIQQRKNKTMQCKKKALENNGKHNMTYSKCYWM